MAYNPTNEYVIQQLKNNASLQEKLFDTYKSVAVGGVASYKLPGMASFAPKDEALAHFHSVMAQPASQGQAGTLEQIALANAVRPQLVTGVEKTMPRRYAGALAVATVGTLLFASYILPLAESHNEARNRQEQKQTVAQLKDKMIAGAGYGLMGALAALGLYFILKKK